MPQATDATVNDPTAFSERTKPFRIDRASVRNALAFAVIPNLPFVIAAHYLATSRPYISLDYMALGILAPFLSVGSAYALFGLLFTLDVLRVLGDIYRFSITELLIDAKDLVHVSPKLVAPVALACLLVLFATAWLIRRLSNQGKSWRRSIEVLVLATLLCGGQAIASRAHRLNTRLTGSFVVADAVELGSALHAVLYPKMPEPAFSAAATEDLLHAQAQNILLVVVESFGVSTNPSITNSALAPFYTTAIQQRYQVVQGTVPFFGGTEAADLRELCSANIHVPSELSFQPCLPVIARGMGFHTISYHGFTEKFFSRGEWYPKLGFEEINFREQLSRKYHLPECGDAFEGSCDTAVARLVRQRLTQNPQERKFVYFLTLNSHLPIANVPTSGKYDCGIARELQQHPAVCAQMAVIYDTLAAVADIASDPKLPPTAILLVGDHAPPYPTIEVRKLFSQHEVPYLMLRPRTTPVHSAAIENPSQSARSGPTGSIQ